MSAPTEGYPVTEIQWEIVVKQFGDDMVNPINEHNAFHRDRTEAENEIVRVLADWGIA